MPVPLQGDPSLLFEALGNLVENALKFTPAGGVLTVTLTESGISVADTGPGIPPEIREHVLKRSSVGRTDGTRWEMASASA